MRNVSTFLVLFAFILTVFSRLVTDYNLAKFLFSQLSWNLIKLVFKHMKAVVLCSNFSAAYLNYRFVENLSLTLHIRRLSVLCLLLANMSAKVILLRDLVPVFDRLLGGHRNGFVCSEHNETIKALL